MEKNENKKEVIMSHICIDAIRGWIVIDKKRQKINNLKGVIYNLCGWNESPKSSPNLENSV